ncbi:MAG: efflux RND transporter periplasmic adaptor subunit [Parcubacteria group bacterium]|nr:efflux RND transporter periplasmic adaptor subunit [Parcubacteria group bacterium]
MQTSNGVKIFKNKYFIILVLLAAGAGFYFFLNKKPAVQYITAKAARGDLIQTVSETGTVKSNQEIDLNFPATGKIAKIYVAVGDKVKKDQVLAELDLSDLALKDKEAQANLRVAQANLAKLLAGATASELAVSQANVDQAKTAYASAVNEAEKIKNTTALSIVQAQKNLDDLSLTSGGLITKEQQTVKNYQVAALTVMEAKIPVAANALDNINTILTDNDAKNFLGAGNAALLAVTKNSYGQANTALAAAKVSLISAKLNQSSSAINQALDNTAKALNQTFSALKDGYSLLEASIAGGSFTQTKLDTYKTNVSAQQTNVTTGISALETAQNNLNDALNNLNNALAAAKDALATAEAQAAEKLAGASAKVDNAYRAWQVALAQLNQLKAGARAQDINLSQAQVSQAQAALDLIRNQIANNIIKAPADGAITKKNYEAGEQFAPGKTVFSLLGASNFQIEVNVSEADITKVAINNPVEITLDAFGQDIKFAGQVNFIEPAETVIQEVVYYKVKINFDGKKLAVKSGMTANTNIITAKNPGVLIIPARAVVEKNHGRFARLLSGQELKEVPVSLGLRGDNGLVEVLSGLSEGDIVVTFIQQNQ